MKFKLIMAFVKPQLSDVLVDAMKKNGATGATIIPAKGTGIHEAKSFFGLTLEAQTEIINFIVEEHAVEKYLELIKRIGKFDQPGTGIAIVLPLDQVIGLESQMHKIEEQTKD